ncbi:MAG TPA: nucleotidyltransferase family protein [Rudaea sp.]|jgi:MurNAc alpha-1-phosphate uridylyltransferase
MIEQALIFAAGRGERMRPLSDVTPKPLLHAGGKRLIEWHLGNLAAAGVREVVINTSHLADQFPAALGDGARWNLRIAYSYEGPQPLETGGGMLRALPLLGSSPFIAVNGDTWTDFDFSTLPQDPPALAHLVLVVNPAHRPDGDFGIDNDGRLQPHPAPERAWHALTFAGIGVYRPEVLADWRRLSGLTRGTEHEPPRFSTVPLLRARMPRGEVSWQFHAGIWTDVGTPQRLDELDAVLHMG